MGEKRRKAELEKGTGEKRTTCYMCCLRKYRYYGRCLFVPPVSLPMNSETSFTCSLNSNLQLLILPFWDHLQVISSNIFLPRTKKSSKINPVIFFSSKQ